MKAGTSVAIGLVVCVLFLSFIGIAVWYVRKKKKKAVGYGGGCVIPAPMGSSHMSGSFFSIVLALQLLTFLFMVLYTTVIHFQLGIISIV